MRFFFSWVVKGWLAVRHFLLHLQLRIALSCRRHRVPTKIREKRRNEAGGVTSNDHLAPCFQSLASQEGTDENKLQWSPLNSNCYAHLLHLEWLSQRNITCAHTELDISDLHLTSSRHRERRGCFVTRSRMQPSCLQGGRTALPKQGNADQQFLH